MFDILQQLLNQGGMAGGGWADMFKPLNFENRPDFLKPLNFNQQQNPGLPSNMKVLSGDPNSAEMQNFLGVSPASYGQLLQQNKVPAGNFNLNEYVSKPYEPPGAPLNNSMTANNMQQQMLMQQMLSGNQQQPQQTPPVGAAPMPMPMGGGNRQPMQMQTMGMPGPAQVMSPTRRRIIGGSLG
jgi:hypothetical protein